MAATVASATDLRTKTRDMLERAKFTGEHFVLESLGKPMMAIVGVQEPSELIALRDRLPNPEREDDLDAAV